MKSNEPKINIFGLTMKTDAKMSLICKMFHTKIFLKD